LALTAEKVINKVQKAVQDTSIVPDEDYIPWINECIEFVSGKTLLAELQMTDTVSTVPGQNSVAMPDDFMRMLFSCYNNTANKPVHIHANVACLPTPVGATSGNVTGVALQGKTLYYVPSPSAAQTLKVDYYREPTEIKGETDTIADLPLYIAPQLLHYYLCYKSFELIEDGAEENSKVNTTYYATQFNNRLDEFIKENRPLHEPLPFAARDVLQLNTFS